MAYLPVWYKGVQGVEFRGLAIMRFSFDLFCSFSLEKLQKIAFMHNIFNMK